jgi:hypothetical protein
VDEGILEIKMKNSPRQCGIATFTTDLREAIADEYKGRIALIR